MFQNLRVLCCRLSIWSKRNVVDYGQVEAASLYSRAHPHKQMQDAERHCGYNYRVLSNIDQPQQFKQSIFEFRSTERTVIGCDNYVTPHNDQSQALKA